VEAGKPLFGVCNGFQVLVEAGLLPALGGTMTETPEAVLATNDSGHYECRPSYLRLENSGSCAFTRTLERGQVVTFISAHAEGKLFGVQPHPERCFFRHLHPDWTRAKLDQPLYGDGKAIFDGALDYVERKF